MTSAQVDEAPLWPGSIMQSSIPQKDVTASNIQPQHCTVAGSVGLPDAFTILVRLLCLGPTCSSVSAKVQPAVSSSVKNVQNANMFRCDRR